MLLSQVPGYYKTRRQALQKAHPNSAFLLPAAPEVLRNPDCPFPFRQETNLYYLTGFEEPESFLVLTPSKSVLFVRKRDIDKEMWEGERYGTDRAVSVFGVDEAYLIEELETRLPPLLKGLESVYYRLGQNAEMDRTVLAVLDHVRRSFGRSGMPLASVLDPLAAIAEMRLFKSPEEVELLRKACQISAQGHRTAMAEVRPGMNEYEIEALIDYSFRKAGCKRLGYESIVAGGKNATCLHYRGNNEILNDGDLLLVDAGGEYGYYSADITRTFPVGKGFTDAQAELYDLVLRSQLAALELCKPGQTLAAIHQRASEVLIEGMLSMGLLKGSVAEIWKSGAHKRFYPHGTGHWLGMEVHDVGLYQKNGEPRPLEPGMVFTVEPGFYVQPGDSEAPGKYRNIGIRIEDDILITLQGHENLTRDVPKTRAEIEALKK